MKQRCERRALTTKRQVCAAKVGNRCDANALSNNGRVADLNRKRVVSIGLVPQRLAVAADRSDLVGSDLRVGKQG